MSPETIKMLEDSAVMFTILATELTVLFLGISYLVGILQAYVPPEKIKHYLSAQNGKGYVLASLMGAITPFCSCSTIPFLKGLLRAGAGFGPMMVFLFSSPLLNPIVIGLFAVTFSTKVAAVYFLMAFGVSIIAGYMLDKLGFEKYIIAEKPEGFAVRTENAEDSETTCCDAPEVSNKWLEIWHSVWADFKTALPYLFIGVLIGSIIHGFVPTDFIAEIANKDNLWAIPFAAVIGIPLYLRAVTLVPLSAVLVAKGMGLGAVMAFVIGSAGASLPELILLKSMFRTPLIVTFVLVVLSMAILSGLVFSLLF